MYWTLAMNLDLRENWAQTVCSQGAHSLTSGLCVVLKSTGPNGAQTDTPSNHWCLLAQFLPHLGSSLGLKPQLKPNMQTVDIYVTST